MLDLKYVEAASWCGRQRRQRLLDIVRKRIASRFNALISVLAALRVRQVDDALQRYFSALDGATLADVTTDPAATRGRPGNGPSGRRLATTVALPSSTSALLTMKFLISVFSGGI